MECDNAVKEFMTDLSALKLRNRNLRKELIRQLRELAGEVQDATDQVIRVDFELLACEEDRLLDEFVSFEEWHESAGKLDHFIPKDDLHWEVDIQSLLKDTNRLETLTKPGVLRMYWTICTMGLWG